MIQVFIDDQPVQVPIGATVLTAARAAGIDLPALCHRDGHPHNTSCMCCLVRVEGRAAPIPSCATPVVEGMHIECETADLRALRRTGIELLFSDHEGDCRAPCQNTCPARMDIPDMLRQAAAGDYQAAIATIKRDIALPATLGRVCPEVCEKACRRAQIDEPAAICQLKRYVADRDLQQQTPYEPPRQPASGQRVAVVGAGPTGLTAAYHLCLAGHEVTLFEREDRLGGRLRTEFPPEQLPRDVLDAEIGVIRQLGVRCQTGREMGSDLPLAELGDRFAAVILATGKGTPEALVDHGIELDKGRIRVDNATQQTSRPGVFAAGGAVRPNPLVIKSVAAGKEVARAVESYLAGALPEGPAKFLQVRRQRLADNEVLAWREAGSVPRVEPDWLEGSGLDAIQCEQAARREAERCLHCDCGALGSCQLRRYADAYDCDPLRFKGAKRQWNACLEHRLVRLEPGKCIQCGICVQIASELGEPIGLTFVGRGFEVRIGVPLDRSLDEALLTAGPACADACPTGAISRQQRVFVELGAPTGHP